jgi:hypothetical protein
MLPAALKLLVIAKEESLLIYLSPLFSVSSVIYVLKSCFPSSLFR